MIPRHVIYYGVDQPLPERRNLRAGPLALLYENGDLRHIRLGDHEIIQRIYAAVRDHNWGTAPNVLSNVQMAVEPDSFRIQYEVDNRLGDIAFRWTGTISGDAQGAITFIFDGQAHATFLRNRIGFCVLYPLDCAGAVCRIVHSDGAVEASQFPLRVAPQLYQNGRPTPHGAFHSMRALTHQVTREVWAEVRFEGDEFETEDQRNWIDASYKTYCTPLQLPFPVEVQQGARITQTVRLTLQGTVPTIHVEDQTQPMEVSIRPDAAPIPLPPLGLGVASHAQPLTLMEIERLRALNLAHLRVDLHLSKPGWETTLSGAAGESRALGVGLEAALFLSDAAEAELSALVAALRNQRPQVSAWLVFYTGAFSTPQPIIQQARNALAAYDPAIPLGAGTNANLAELNRARPPAHLPDFVTLAANPQVHAFDNTSLAENCAALRHLVDTVHEFSGGKRIALSPITLKARFNPVATGPETPPPPGELPSQVDPRQMSLFGAGWTLGSLKYLAENPATYSITYYETTGWRGVMETEAGSPLPQKFRSSPGGVFPLYHVLADVGDYRGGEVIPVQSSQPLYIEALLLRRERRACLLLANLDSQPHTARIAGLSGAATYRLLDETTAETAMRWPEAFRVQLSPLLPDAAGEFTCGLLPYGLARIDFKPG
jgi:hypothetical protein